MTESSDFNAYLK